MKIRLGRGAMVAAGAVAASLFVMLCMTFYGRDDYLSPERILARGDALRFRIASVFVQPLGAGAYLGFGLLLAWSVIAYFRESVGSLLPRLVGTAACIPSFCALTSLSSDPHQFWAGSVGIWMGDVVYRGFGPALGWLVLGTLFVVSLALATEMGFHAQLGLLRGSLSFPLLPPEEVAPDAREAAVAVLEPPPAVAVATPEAVIAAAEQAAAAPAEDASEAVLVDREQHLADVRRREAAGEPVTEAEGRLLREASEQAQMAVAIDSLFDRTTPAPAAAPVEPAEPAEPVAPAAPAAALPPLSMPDVPPFLLGPASLFSQEISVEGPAAPRAEPLPPRPEPVAPKAAAAPEAPASEVISERAPYIFAAVEFLPPNEELADAPADVPSLPAEAVEPDPASDAAADLPAFLAGPVPAPEAEVAPESVSVPAPEAVPAEFEDEFFAYGFEEEAVEPPAAAVIEPAPVEEPEPAVEEPAPAVEEPAVPEPAEEAAPAPVEPPAEDSSWLLAAARDLGIEPVAEEAPAAEFFAPAPAPEVVDDVSAPAETPAAVETPDAEETPVEETPPADPAHDALARLFGDPVVRLEEPESAPPGPAQQEPREPPANLQPVIEEVQERVTLLTDEVVTDCLTDHGVLVDQQVTLPPPSAIDDDAPPAEVDAGPAAPAPAAPAAESAVVSPAEDEGFEPVEGGMPAEAAAEAILGCFPELFRGTASETPAEATAEPPALAAHGWGTLFPSMIDDAPAAEAAAPPQTPAPVQEPADETDLRAEAAPPAVETPAADLQAMAEVLPPPSQSQEIPVELVRAASTPTEDMDAVAASRPQPVEDPASETHPEEELPQVDEALVRRLVEGLKAEMPSAPTGEDEEGAPAPEGSPEEAPAPVLAPGERDPLYEEAVKAVRERGRGSVVVLQRKLGIGFTRATKVLESLVADGILGPENAAGSHPVL